MQSSAERSIVKILKKKIDFLLDTTYQRLHSYKMPEPGLQLTAPASKFNVIPPWIILSPQHWYFSKRLLSAYYVPTLRYMLEFKESRAVSKGEEGETPAAA